jgi:hypothetical protein
MLDETQLENEIQSKGLNAPRLTPDDIDACIKYTEYWVVPNTTSTVCAMVLQNNFVVIGKSAAASMVNFDEEIGKKIAYDNAREQIWQLEGYLLKDKLFKGEYK